MNFEIIAEPIRFHLHGLSGVVDNQRYGEVGLRLMNAMWQVVKEVKTPNTGINHWVYLPGNRLFVGVELKDPKQTPIPEPLAPLEFELPRYLKHIHIGPYQGLPQKWKDLQTELVAGGEAMSLPSLEIYGHHCEDPDKLTTTILIGLQKRSA